MLRWKQAFSFPSGAAARQEILRAGWLLFVLPPLGWLLALGYRAAVAFRLRDGEAEVFPRWEVSARRLVDGCRAAGIIFAYFLPFLTLFWALAAGSLQALAGHAGEIVTLTLCLPLFLPVTIPALILVYPHHAAWIQFDRMECVALLITFVATVFILPAAFMRVALTRRFAAALNVGAAVLLIRRRWRPYLEAWLISVAATAAALLSGPFSPWMILWSYLVIGFAFNEVLGTGS